MKTPPAPTANSFFRILTCNAFVIFCCFANATAQDTCSQAALQSCTVSCINDLGTACNSSVQTDLDLSSVAIGECCRIGKAKKRKACYKRYQKLTRNKAFRQMVGSETAAQIRSDIQDARKGTCSLATTSGVLNGSASPLSEKFFPPVDSCSGEIDDTLFPYESRALQVLKTESYDIKLTLGSCAGNILIYSGDFDVNNPNANCFFYGDAAANSETSFTVDLNDNTTYTVVMVPGADVNNCSYELRLTASASS